MNRKSCEGRNTSCEWISISLSFALSVCCLYYSRLMGTREIVLVVNGAENGVVLEGDHDGVGRQEARLTSVPRLISSMGFFYGVSQAELI